MADLGVLVRQLQGKVDELEAAYAAADAALDARLDILEDGASNYAYIEWQGGVAIPSFSVPRAGRWAFDCQGSAWAPGPGGGLVYLNFYIDSITGANYIGQLTNYFNELNSHRDFTNRKPGAPLSLSAGAHSILAVAGGAPIAYDLNDWYAIRAIRVGS